MARAIELAERGRYTVSPNPLVGCVIVRDGAVIGEGWHERAGEDHAEVAALRRCPEPRGATMFVTLEPCAHQGRTPPCADAVIAAGIQRVVVATIDPHEIVNGHGIERLRASGVAVVIGVNESEARRQNEKFLWAATQKLPFVLLKAALTLDGKMATQTRDSQWITSEEARERSLMLREEYDAIVIGSGTIKADNPRLTRRLGLATTAWTRVVLDGEGEIPAHAQILAGGGKTILFTSRPPLDRGPDLEVVETEGHVDIEHVLGELYARGIRSVIVEGGAVVHADVIRRGLWQKMTAFIAPMVIGGTGAPSLLSDHAVDRLTDAYRFRFDRAEFVGRDLMITAYPL